jgi:uncharacterized protein (DUF488 family)
LRRYSVTTVEEPEKSRADCKYLNALEGPIFPPVIFTIGHSTRTLDSFVTLLQAEAIRLVVDIRTIPRSRRNPQFNQETLPEQLGKYGISYVHLPRLGGLRRPHAGSVNTGWHNDSFRGFADYMQTSEFESGLTGLLKLLDRGPLAIMCAEAVPWKCHRSLVADALLVRKFLVEHIMGPASRRKHALTPFAYVEGTRITYPTKK